VGEHPSFFGVMATAQGVGAIAGGITAGTIVRRLGDVRASGVGLALFGLCALLLTLPWLPVVLLGFSVAGVGIAWVLVGYGTALQTRTPIAIQGRVSASADLAATLAQTTSIATGAALSLVVDYRILLVVMAAVLAGSALYLGTRREPYIPAEVAPLAVD
jgi:MFS family permease